MSACGFPLWVPTSSSWHSARHRCHLFRPYFWPSVCFSPFQVALANPIIIVRSHNKSLSSLGMDHHEGSFQHAWKHWPFGEKSKEHNVHGTHMENNSRPCLEHQTSGSISKYGKKSTFHQQQPATLCYKAASPWLSHTWQRINKCQCYSLWWSREVEWQWEAGKKKKKREISLAGFFQRKPQRANLGNWEETFNSK